MKSRDQKLTFSIRKLTIGAVSVMFGALIFGVSTTQVHAETTNDSAKTQTEQVQTKTDDTNQQTQTPAIQSNKDDNVKAEAPQENQKIAASKNETTTQQTQTPESTNTAKEITKSNEPKNTTNTPKEPVASPTKNTDQAIDQVNIDDWSYQNLDGGNVEVNTKNGVTYTGDIVIPNTADLIKAGKITISNGKAYITGGTLHTLTGTKGVTSITISKNDNSKLYVKGNSLAYAFGNDNQVNKDLKKLDVAALDVSNVTDFDQLFELNPNLTEIDGLNTWDVSNVKSMCDTFYATPKLTSEAFSGLTNWNTKNLQTLFAAFEGDSSLTNLNFLKNWNTSNLNSMLAIFAYDSNLTDISGMANWDVSKVTAFNSAFLGTDSLQGLVDLSNWAISDKAQTDFMFLPARATTPLMVIVKSGAENINKGKSVFGSEKYYHYLYRVENDGQVIQTLPSKAFNSANDAVKEINDNLANISKTLNKKGYTFSGWQKENQYGNTGAYALYVAKWTSDTPNKPTTPVQPTNGPVLPENTPSNNSATKTVKPHAEKVTKHTTNRKSTNIKSNNKNIPSGKQAAAKFDTEVVKGEQKQVAHTALVLNNKHAETINSKNQTEDELPQTGAKESSGILGFILAGLGIFGLAADRKRKKQSIK